MATTKRTTASNPSRPSNGTASDKSVDKSVFSIPPRFTFETEENSPFTDGYSIAKETVIVEAFMREELISDTDPRYDRYIELEDRKERLEAMKTRFVDRKGADPLVEREEVMGLNTLGGLVDEETDQMTIHTKEAYRMFMGRAREPGTLTQPIIGGKRIASALLNLWQLTGKDNPFADWGLLRHEHAMREVHKRLQRDIDVAQALLNDQQRRGLTYSILKSAEPKVLNLGYGSPYGYAVSGVIVDFDYFVRLQKTMARKDLRTDDQVRGSIAELTRFVRRCWNETARFDRWLRHEDVRNLSRADFVPGVGVDAAKRVEFATGVFGPVPSAVYTCALQPEHSRRRLQITPAEQKLIQSVGKKLTQEEQAAVAAQEAGAGKAQEADAGQAQPSQAGTGAA